MHTQIKQKKTRFFIARTPDELRKLRGDLPHGAQGIIAEKCGCTTQNVSFVLSGRGGYKIKEQSEKIIRMAEKYPKRTMDDRTKRLDLINSMKPGSQKEIAQKFGCSKSMVSNILNGNCSQVSKLALKVIQMAEQLADKERQKE